MRVSMRGAKRVPRQKAARWVTTNERDGRGEAEGGAKRASSRD